MRIVSGLKAGASLAEAARLIAQAFKAAGIEEPLVDARALLGRALRLDRTQLIAQSDRILETREVDAVSALVARRLKREPVARILGAKEFWSLPLAVTPDVLVPRPETETVVEAALEALARDGAKMAKLRILDIGTGSGALLLALLPNCPTRQASPPISARRQSTWRAPTPFATAWPRAARFSPAISPPPCRANSI